MKLILLVCISLFAANLQAKETSEPDGAVVLKGGQISNAQIFSTFLALVTNDETSGLAATGLGFDIEGHQGLSDFQKFQKKMELVDVKLKRSLRNTWYETHCIDGKGAFAKTRGQILRDMDTAEDLQRLVTKKHLDRAIKSLSQKDKTLVLNYLSYMKESTKVITGNAEVFEESSSADALRANIAAGCNVVSGEYYLNNGEYDEEQIDF